MRHRTSACLPTIALLGALTACSADEQGPVITPGAGIGSITLGMRYREVSALYGEMAGAIVDGRIAVGGYPDQGLDMILTSPEASKLTPDAVVIAVGATTAAYTGFPTPGLTRTEIEASLGRAPLNAGSIDYYLSGISVKYAAGDGEDVAKAVGVFAPFTHAPTPPEMKPVTAQGGV